MKDSNAQLSAQRAAGHVLMVLALMFAGVLAVSASTRGPFALQDSSGPTCEHKQCGEPCTVCQDDGQGCTMRDEQAVEGQCDHHGRCVAAPAECPIDARP